MRRDEIVDALNESARVTAALAGQAAGLAATGRDLVRVLRRGGTVYTAGNGGSAAEALHMAEELTGRFRSNRRPLPAVALAADPTALTCIANDFGFDQVFCRPLEALGRRGDAAVLFSTSGASRNMVLALDTARRRGLLTVCLLGRGGGAMAGRGDHEVVVPSDSTARIQEAHQVVMHLLLEIIEDALGEKKP